MLIAGLVGVSFLAGCNLKFYPSVLPTLTASPTLSPSAIATSTPPPPPTETPTSTPTPSPTPRALALLGTVERDVTYCTMGGVPVLMDVYYPDRAGGPWPVAIIVHGGAWITGDKESSASLALQPGLTAMGFLVVSINYRLAPAYPWPAMIEDAKCAVRSLRAHAAEYNLDPGRIGAVGDSVGGQIVLLLGLTDPTVGWDVGEYLDYSSKIQAVVDFFGPTDLTDDSLSELIFKRGAQAFYDISFNSPELIAASPITYVRSDAPPIFIAHGNLDLTVRYEQSQMFYDKMIALGAQVTLVKMVNGIHSFAPVYYDVQPSYEEVYAMSVNFLTDMLASPESLPALRCQPSAENPPMSSPGAVCFQEH